MSTRASTCLALRACSGAMYSGVPAPVPVRVSSDDLTACVDALLGNVFAHTPEGRDMAVRLTSRPDGGAILVVRDQGPGLPDPMLLGRGRSGAGSTGLGLDIVRRIATGAGGSVALDRAPGGGAMITVEVAGPLAMPARHG